MTLSHPPSRRARALLAALSVLACTGLAPPAYAQDKPVAVVQPLDGTQLRIEVLSLRRIEGDWVQLRWQVVNDSGSDFGLTTSNTKLMDLANRRQYSAGPAIDSCRTHSGERAVCWALFGAPPAAVKTVSVKFYGNFDIVGGIPVQPAEPQRPTSALNALDRNVRIDEVSLKRTEGNLLTLRWRVTNSDRGDFAMVPSNAKLQDLAGGRYHSPGTSIDRCVARPGEQATCWAVFGAPPATTKTMAVQFHERFDLFTGVPISD